MFKSITNTSKLYLLAQIDELKTMCDKDPAVAEMVRYILAYSDQMAYCGGDDDARIGRQIIQHIWEINGTDLSSLGNSIHFDPSWAHTLNSFIGNFVYDDAAFEAVLQKFVQACQQMQQDGWWWHTPEMSNKAIRRQILKETLFR